jgi:1-aminocyclopropane-1-carboxylate deaminase/D-cysteine desulfhydrase-like pyridoxal-dependent ACC family enzyme
MTRAWTWGAEERLRALRAAFPLVPLLGASPTPLNFLERFSEAVGVQIWIKRDDIASFGVAGAKARKLEFIVADALRLGVDALVTIGPAQSNTCRALAASCAASGLRAHLLFAGPQPKVSAGNALLAETLGAEVRWVGDIPMGGYHEALREYVETLEQSGVRVLTIAPGCSSALGVVGMAAGYLEMLVQASALGLTPTRIVHSSATGGIWAGLTLGASLVDGPRACSTLVVDDLYPDTRSAYASIFNDAARVIGHNARIRPDEVLLDESQLYSGYGKCSPEVVSAIRLLARTEGVICEPIYGGKALASLISKATHGQLKGPVVFWHTGGVQALGDPDVAQLLAT